MKLLRIFAAALLLAALAGWWLHADSDARGLVTLEPLPAERPVTSWLPEGVAAGRIR